MKKVKKTKKGFTLLEILLVVAAISILAGIVIVAINPAKQLGDTRNAQRRADVTTILNAAYQYSMDNGSLPSSITTTDKEICKMGATCTGLVDLSELTNNARYLTGIPVDPSSASSNGAGYHIIKDANGRLTVSTSLAEPTGTISVSR